MIHYPYGIVLKKSPLTSEHRQIIDNLFQRKFLPIPKSTINWESQCNKFVFSNDCVRILYTTNYVYVYSWALQCQIDIPNGKLPKILCEDATPLFVYNQELVEFFLNDMNSVMYYTMYGNIKPMNLLALSKRFDEVVIYNEEEFDTKYCIEENGEKNCFNELELGSEVLFDILNERFEYQDVIDNQVVSDNYYILFDDELNNVNVKFYTNGNDNTQNKEEENVLEQTNFEFAMEIWRSISDNTKEKTIWEYTKVFINFLLAIGMLLVLMIFGKDEQSKSLKE